MWAKHVSHTFNLQQTTTITFTATAATYKLDNRTQKSGSHFLKSGREKENFTEGKNIEHHSILLQSSKKAFTSRISRILAYFSTYLYCADL